MRDQAESAQVEVEEIRPTALEGPAAVALSPEKVAAFARSGAARQLPPAAAIMLQRQVGNRATRRMLARAYGDDALVQAATGKAVEAVEWLQGQSMEALVAILQRAKQRKGVIDQLMAALNHPDAIQVIGAGGKRLEAAVRAATVAGGKATGAELMKISLLMDEAGLPQDQRDMINGLTKTATAPKGTDGLDTALAHGDFRTAFAYLNGIDMARMLKRLRGLGDAWLLPMYAQREQAGFLGEASRTRLEIAMVAAQRARAGSANADDVTWLKEQMAKISLPSDQQEEVLKVMPQARPPQETIREYFSQADVSPLVIPWAVERTLRLLNGRTPEAIRKILISLADTTVVLALIRNSKLGDGKYDMESIRQGIQQAWGEEHPGIEAPWGIVQSEDISKLPAADKLRRAVEAAPLKAELKKRCLEQLTPENLAILGTFTGLYIAAQATPAGWAADIIVAGLTVAGLVMAGDELLAILGELMEFFKVVDAKTREDIDRAAQHFAAAVSKLEMDIVMAVLLHKVTKTATGAAESAMRGTAGETAKVYKLEPKSPNAVELPPDALEGRGSRKVVAGETKTAPFGELLGEHYDPQGTSEITVKVGRPPGRASLERSLPRACDVDADGWHRAHQQGNITGAESGQGIRYAPLEVNLKLQASGIERFLADLFLQRGPGVEVHLTTRARAHPGTLRLSWIQYEVELVKASGERIKPFTALIEIADVRDAPKVELTVQDSGWARLEEPGWLKEGEAHRIAADRPSATESSAPVSEPPANVRVDPAPDPPPPTRVRIPEALPPEPLESVEPVESRQPQRMSVPR